MSKTTTYATRWGQMHVTYDGARQFVSLECKSCGTLTTAKLAANLNPRLHIKPKHTADCPFVKPPVLVAPEATTNHVVPFPAPTPVAAAFPPALTWALIGALIILLVLAGVVGHAL